MFILYGTAFEEERQRLVETAQSQARLIEAVARFDAAYSEKGYPGSSSEATFIQIMDAHKHYRGFGQTGEFTLAHRQDDSIVFLLSHRHFDLDKPKPISFESNLAEPMRRALSGLSGTVVGLDYRGESVLAAYEPVSVLNSGIVAKIDLSEIRAPFVKAAYAALAATLLFVLAGSGLFVWVTGPMIRQLQLRTRELAKMNEQLQQEIADRRRAEEHFRKSQERYRTLVDTMNEGLVILDPNTQITYVNDRMCKMLAYSREEMLGCFASSLLDSTNQEILREQMERRREGERNPYEITFTRKDGKKKVTIVSPSPIFSDDGHFEGSFAVITDITERKRSEEHIRNLSQQLMQAQEVARQKLACDLHDNLAQDLSTLKIGLATLCDDQPDIAPAFRQRVSELSRRLRHSIMTVRDMAYDLHPATLEELGLVQTVRQYCEEFAAKFAIETEVFSVGLDGIELDFDTEISLYRMIQEGLNNVRKHAEASQVIIRLSVSFPYIMLSIEDNGTGFDVDKHMDAAFREKRMGLRSMEQRVAFLDGKMKIESSPALGTRILAKIPYTEKTNG